MKQLFVTLKSSDNENLEYPCRGLLEIQDVSIGGGILYAAFYEMNPNGGYYAPCAVRNVEFVYPAV